MARYHTWPLAPADGGCWCDEAAAFASGLLAVHGERFGELGCRVSCTLITPLVGMQRRQRGHDPGCCQDFRRHGAIAMTDRGPCFSPSKLTSAGRETRSFKGCEGRI